MRNPSILILRGCHWRGATSGRGGSVWIGAVVFVLTTSGVAFGGYVWWQSQRDSRANNTDAILHTVGRDDFSLSITARGEIESASVTEVRSEVKSKNTAGIAILRIVPEGTDVQPGEFLVELDSSALHEDRITQLLAVHAVEALATEARNGYETAVISHREYLEGTYVQERQTIESEVFVAEENLNRAREYYEYSKKLAAKGYVNQLQLEADQFAIEKSQKEMAAANTKLTVLDSFTKEKMLKQLDSDINIGKSRYAAQTKSLELEMSKLAEIEDQIARCTITAPQAGTVFYAHNSDRGRSEEFIVEEGAVIRERQTIILLPDTSAMQVLVRVNESMIQHVRPGLPALLTPVGVDDVPLHGRVQNVNRYAEPAEWLRANVKEYKTLVSIDDTADDLRIGMTASVTIQCDYVQDALIVPVQAVHAYGDQLYCLVHDGTKWEARLVSCGPTNDRFVVVQDGLSEGERVAMNPRRYLGQVDLPKLPPDNLSRLTTTGRRS